MVMLLLLKLNPNLPLKMIFVVVVDIDLLFDCCPSLLSLFSSLSFYLMVSIELDDHIELTFQYSVFTSFLKFNTFETHTLCNLKFKSIFWTSTDDDVTFFCFNSMFEIEWLNLNEIQTRNLFFSRKKIETCWTWNDDELNWMTDMRMMTCLAYLAWLTGFFLEWKYYLTTFIEWFSLKTLHASY